MCEPEMCVGTWSVAVMEEENMLPNRGSSLRGKDGWMLGWRERRKEGYRDGWMDDWMNGVSD